MEATQHAGRARQQYRVVYPSENMAGSQEDVATMIALIQHVEKKPCLWNYTLKTYSRADVTSLAWRNIAEEMKDAGKFKHVKLFVLLVAASNDMTYSCLYTAELTYVHALHHAL